MLFWYKLKKVVGPLKKVAIPLKKKNRFVENQGVYYVIRAGFGGSVFRQSSILWSQNTREEKLGTGIPAVLHGSIVSILFNAVRIRRDHKYGILHTEIQHISVRTHTNYDIQRISECILKYTRNILLQQSIYSYILVCTLYICVYSTEYLTQGLSLGLGIVLFLKSNAKNPLLM